MFQNIFKLLPHGNWYAKYIWWEKNYKAFSCIFFFPHKMKLVVYVWWHALCNVMFKSEIGHKPKNDHLDWLWGNHWKFYRFLIERRLYLEKKKKHVYCSKMWWKCSLCMLVYIFFVVKKKKRKNPYQT